MKAIPKLTVQFSKNQLFFPFLSTAVCISLLLFPSLSFAGTGGPEFQGMANTIQALTTGWPLVILLTLGVAFGVFLLVTKHTIIPIAMVVVAGVIASSAPGVISGLVSAII